MSKSTLTAMDPTVEEFGAWLQTPGFRKPQATVLHHTWSPSAAQYRGRDNIVAIRRYHMGTRGASDILANGYAGPEGQIVTGRPLDRDNWAHAHISRAQPEAEAWGLARGDRQYFNRNAFGLETVANFDSEDPFGSGPAAHSFECALDALTVLHSLFAIPVGRLFFHRDVADKSCPGAKVSRDWVRNEIQRRLKALTAPPAVKVVLAIGEVGTVIDCQPEMQGSDVTVLAAPLLVALGVSVGDVPAGVIHGNGRAYLHDLAPYCPEWTFWFKQTSQGPRVYVKGK